MAGNNSAHYSQRAILDKGVKKGYLLGSIRHTKTMWF